MKPVKITTIRRYLGNIGLIGPCQLWVVSHHRKIQKVFTIQKTRRVLGQVRKIPLAKQPFAEFCIFNDE